MNLTSMDTTPIARFRRGIRYLRQYDDDFPIQYLDVFLMVVHESALGNDITQQQIADTLGMTASAVSRAVGALGKVGARGKLGLDLLEMDTDVMDRRKKYLRLTARGKALIEMLYILISTDERPTVPTLKGAKVHA